MNVYTDSSHERIFGTYPLTGDTLRSALEDAYAVGYRAFDTAQEYENESVIGDFLASVGPEADGAHLTTKVMPANFGSATEFLSSVEKSLERLRVERVNVLLVHWPPIGEDILPSLDYLQQALQRGFAEHIGISNYTRQMMHTAAAAVEVPLAVNQVEFHPLIDQSPLEAGALETGIPLSSYCSLARGAIAGRPEFEEIGRAYGKTGTQVALRWILQKGIPVITMSTSYKNIKSNFDIVDFELSHSDVEKIEAMRAENYRVISLEEAPWAPRWDTPTPRENRPAASFTRPAASSKGV
ncbi:aldo/keto reductase [Leucobacter sp. UCD-THU]|uniref:aldo/keto reductase n=1 Tax=Leucobacter sp. UCD-THU TaxID=1292023 RepID=UPI0009DA84F5|nr:aldo/keto reductase [Leucobacter sp. UCD-THU]